MGVDALSHVIAAPSTNRLLLSSASGARTRVQRSTIPIDAVHEKRKCGLIFIKEQAKGHLTIAGSVRSLEEYKANRRRRSNCYTKRENIIMRLVFRTSIKIINSFQFYRVSQRCRSVVYIDGVYLSRNAVNTSKEIRSIF